LANYKQLLVIIHKLASNELNFQNIRSEMKLKYGERNRLTEARRLIGGSYAMRKLFIRNRG